MSADNGIYICESPNGRFHVIHAQAIDNLGYYPAGSLEEAEQWQRYFGGGFHCSTKGEAYAEANRMAQDIFILEYGISDLGMSPVNIEELS